MSVNVATEITKDEFEAYVGVQKSGITSIYAVSFVADLSGLEKKQCLYIMKHYSELADKYPGVI